MPSPGFYLLVLGLAPIALSACVETGAATAQPTLVVAAVGIDLGNSARVPQIAGLAGEGEGYGRAEPGPSPAAHSSMPGMDRGSTSNMQMDHGTMPDMNHGSTSSMQMDQGTMPGMSHGSMSGMQMDHGSMSRMKHRSISGMQMDHGAMPAMSGAMNGMQMVHSGHAQAQSSGTVNSVDATAHKVNVSHGPISAIGLPAMTMDFKVAPSVDLQTVKPGTRIKLTIEQGEDGMYVIQSIMPAGGGR